MAASELETLQNSFDSQMASASYSDAIVTLIRIQGALAILPSGGKGALNLQWTSPREVQSTIDTVRSLLSADPVGSGSSLQFTRIEYCPPTDTSCPSCE